MPVIAATLDRPISKQVRLGQVSARATAGSEMFAPLRAATLARTYRLSLVRQRLVLRLAR